MFTLSYSYFPRSCLSCGCVSIMPPALSFILFCIIQILMAADAGEGKTREKERY